MQEQLPRRVVRNVGEQRNSMDKKKAPRGALLVLAALLYYFGSYLLQILCRSRPLFL